MLELLQRDPTAFAIAAAVLLMGLVLHELGHAVAAEWAGDDTAREAGRITLDPLKHLDLFGTAMLLLIGFGWAKPVPIRPDRFRDFRSGLLLVSIAGVAANLLLALLALFALRLLGSEAPDALVIGLALSVEINVLLAVFNLLPIPPLDGAKVVAALAPAPVQRWLFALERFGFVLVIAVLLLFRGPVFALVDGVTGVLARLVLG